MNKLEELHLNTHSHVAVTEQIAIEFAEWCRKNAVHKRYDIWFYANNDYAIHELFQEFIKTRQ